MKGTERAEPSEFTVEAPSGRRAATRTVPFTVLRPTTGWRSLDLGELWAYRELVYFLIWRDIKIRYKQTVLGASWAVIQPFFTMVIFSVFFGRLAGVPSDDLPYPVFSFAALVPWTFFATALTMSANSLVGNQELLRKVYFPRLAIPLAPVLGGLVDFGIAFVVLLGMMWFYGIVPGLAIFAVVPLVFLTLVTALGVGLWLSALNVQYRDVRYALPFLVQAWLFATPIAYPSSLLDAPWRTLYALNPMVGVVEGFRWALLGANTAPGPMVLVSTLASLTILAGGALYFRRLERSFADIV